MKEPYLDRKIDSEVALLERRIIDWRRYFHQHPELSFREYDTSKKIKSLLRDMGITFRDMAGTGLTASLEGAGDKTIAIRADMDGLPVKEETGLPFSSVNSGVMHACGHDGHMATLLGVASILEKFKKNLPVNVKFIFQPGEELPPGGAPMMIREGVLDDVDSMLGFHYLSFLPMYRLGIVEGNVMASADFFRIEITGRGGHGATPHLNKDPIVCGAHLVSAFQAITGRAVSPLEPAVITIGKFSGGDAANITPEKVEILGTARALSNRTRNLLKKEIILKTKKISGAFGCKSSIEYNMHSPVCKNDKKLARKIINISGNIETKLKLQKVSPTMVSEDFAYYTQKVPSCYLLMGIGQNCGVNHNSRFTINEDIMPCAVSYFAKLILNFNSK